MQGLIDCHVHIQGLNNRSDEDSDAFLYGTMPEIFKEKILPYWYDKKTGQMVQSGEKGKGVKEKLTYPLKEIK